MEWEKKMTKNPQRGGKKSLHLASFFVFSILIHYNMYCKSPCALTGLLINLHNGSANQPKNIQYSTSHFYFTLTAKCGRLKNIRNSTLNEIFLFLLQISYKKKEERWTEISRSVLYRIQIFQFAFLTIRHKFSFEDVLYTFGRQGSVKHINRFSSPLLVYLWWRRWLSLQLTPELSFHCCDPIHSCRTHWHGWDPLCRSTSGTGRWRKLHLLKKEIRS